MTIIELSPAEDEILDLIDSPVQQQKLDRVASRYIIRQTACGRLCRAISVWWQRGKGRFEARIVIPIVLDPLRSETVCVVPTSAECADGVDTYLADDE